MSLLPPQSSDAFEIVLERSFGPRWEFLAAATDAIRGLKLKSPPPSFLPFLVYEYGLGGLTPYVSNVYSLVVDFEGVRWQRLRGTPAAVDQALGWVGHHGVLEDAWHGRSFWNSTQLKLAQLPSFDAPDLERIEGVVRLSLPKRSHLRRVVHAYDVHALEIDGACLDDSMIDTDSGFTFTSSDTLFSFGRSIEVDHLLTEEEGVAIGNWLAPAASEGLPWTAMQYAWITATFPWAENPAVQRRALMAAWFPLRTIYATFRDVNGDVVGHRRCRANHAVRESLVGVYSIGGSLYLPLSGGTLVYIEAMTDFFDANDVEAKSVELTVGGALAAGVRSGKLWLAPGDLIGGNAIASTTVSLPLRTTVREQVKFLLRF